MSTNTEVGIRPL